jgi:Ca-activated chloride channel family protein
VKRRLFVVLVAALAAVSARPGAQQDPPPAPAAPARPAPQRPPAFRAGIDLVSLHVTVTDSGGRYVTDLAESEFQVFENGVKQNVTFFSRRENPIALSMLLDSSASMEQKLPVLQLAAANFVRRLKPNDIAQIVDFDAGVTVRQDFTSNKADLEHGIQQMSPGGSTALHNAIYVALDGLKRISVGTDEEPRRQALIVFSDGQDTSSLLPFDDVLDRAKRSEVAIYTIGLRDPNDQVRGFRSAEHVLQQLALETGGRAFFPANLNGLSGVYGQIADELASQYALGYTSTNPRRDGAWRPIVVQLSRPNVRPRTKTGYYAPPPSR